MTPQALYFARVNVTSVNKLKNLQQVKATIYYDQEGTNPAPVGGGNTQTQAILTWDVTLDSWSIDPAAGPGTTWVLVTGSCTHPELTANPNQTNGNWNFYFRPGKVATEAPSVAHVNAEWDAQGLAQNKQLTWSTATYLAADKGMYWYGEITVAGTVDWSNVDLGLVFATEPPNPKPDAGVSNNYIANGDYYEDIASEDWDDGALETVTLREDWSDNDNPPDVAGQFALKADDDATLAGAVTVKKATTEYVHINNTGAQTGEPGVDVTTNSLWLSLSETGILPGTYEGSIWYQVAERP